jgi:hypothetical protein
VAETPGLDFPGAVRVARIRRDGYDRDGQLVSKQIVHAVTSLTADQAGPAALAAIARGQWGIESVHWLRDVTWAEDANTGYAGNGPQVMATLRNTAISLLHLAGITKITRTVQAIARNPTRVLALIPYRYTPIRLCLSRGLAEARFSGLGSCHTGIAVMSAGGCGGSWVRAMGLDISEVRGIVERVFARRDVLDACARRDLGATVAVLGTQGVMRGQISELTGIGQGRLSEWVRHKRAPAASSTFEAFADGLAVPAAARQALGLAPVPAGGSGSGRSPGPGPGAESPGGGVGPPARAPSGPGGPAVAGLPGLQGLEGVRGQLDAVIAMLKAEQVRRKAGLGVRRPAWKNLVFTGPAGSGKSGTAIAVGQAYRKLGVLANGRVLQVAAADLAGAGPEETGKLVGNAARLAVGGILMINDAHYWDRLPDSGHQVLRRLYETLSEYRDTLDDELAVVLAGQEEPLGRLLRGIPPLAARFRAVIHFPGFTPGELSAIFVTLADEAGLKLTTAARAKAAAVLAQAQGDDVPDNARLAVALLNQATAAQAGRLAAWPSRNQTPVALATISEGDIPDRLSPETGSVDDDWPGQYL